MSAVPPDAVKIMPAPKRPAWFKALSLPLQGAVIFRCRKDGYESELDGWITDLLTTAYRSPQGMLLRLAKPVSEEHATHDPGKDGAHPELPLTHET